MSLYLVEHRLGNVGEGHLAALRGALLEIAARLDGAIDGQQIRFLRSTVVSGPARCICLFEASSEALVRHANELAQVPISWIGPAIDFDFTNAKENQ